MKKFYLSLIVVVVLGVSMAPSKAVAQFFVKKNESVGKNAQDFTLKTLGGPDLSLSKFSSGKNTVVFFWATWCPHCRKALTELNARQEEFTKKDIKLVLVNIGEDEATVRSYAQKNKINLTIFLDVDTQVAESYAIVGVPTFYFVDAKGMVKEVKHSLPDNFEALFN